MKALSARQIGETFEIHLLAIMDTQHDIICLFKTDNSSSLALRVQALADMTDLLSSAGVVVAGAEMVLNSQYNLKGAADALERVQRLYRAVTDDLAGALIRLNKA